MNYVFKFVNLTGGHPIIEYGTVSIVGFSLALYFILCQSPWGCFKHLHYKTRKRMFDIFKLLNNHKTTSFHTLCTIDE
jgi:hypothetical protein